MNVLKYSDWALLLTKNQKQCLVAMFKGPYASLVTPITSSWRVSASRSSVCVSATETEQKMNLVIFFCFSALI